MIYLDNAATTKPYKEVVDILSQASEEYFANPSSIHSLGSRARASLDNARSSIADMLGCQASEIYFTSGATESINWALKGIDFPIITSKADHKAVLETCRSLEGERKIHYVDVSATGLIDMEALDRLASKDRSLISFLYANNETGVIQNIDQVCQISRDRGAIIHIDGVQALGKLDLNIGDLGLDLLSLSGHKIHGPKGVGLLYINKDLRIHSLIDGGSQENEKRAGTENLPGILAFEKAIEISLEDVGKRNQEIRNLRDYMEDNICRHIEGIKINGGRVDRLSNISSLSFKGVDSSALLMMLDLEGICISAGSACAAGSLEKSHVLKAMDISEEYIGGTIRVSLSHENTKEEIDIFIEKLIKIIAKLRS